MRKIVWSTVLLLAMLIMMRCYDLYSRFLVRLSHTFPQRANDVVFFSVSGKLTILEPVTIDVRKLRDTKYILVIMIASVMRGHSERKDKRVECRTRERGCNSLCNKNGN